MRASKRLNWFFDLPVVRWILILLFCGLLFRMFFLTPLSGYDFSHSETAKIISIQPDASRYGGSRVVLSFRLENGNLGIMSLPEWDTTQAGQTIHVEVLIKDGKNPRYRLAAEPIAP